jgi:cysteinyl-tRNA synthetase
MRNFKLYNTLSRENEIFVPINKDEVTVYSCGPTVYSSPHIGNMRAYTFTDTLIRTLNYLGYNVKNAINITDVGHLTSDSDEGDDKLEKAAKATNTTAYQIAEKYTDMFWGYMNDLNIIPPSVYPKATEHIQEQIDLILDLEIKGYTYITSDGVYFDTSKFESYADLSKLDVDGLREGIRVDANEKKNKTDFALWKFSPENEKRDMEWNSPWGIGFPGWHVECSAMAMKHLGNQIDIHTGGIDHIPIHHTNEIAQSEASTGHKFSNYWLHVNFLQLLAEDDDAKEDVNDDAEIKMSKSKGTAYTISDLNEMGIEPLVLKYFYLTAHYRNELKFNFKLITAAKNTFLKMRKKILVIKNGSDDFNIRESSNLDEIIKNISNDLDTPNVLANFHNALNSSELSRDQKLTIVESIDGLFSLDLLTYEDIFDIPAEIIELAQLRWDAKNNKDWSLADDLRNQIINLGYVIEDKGSEYKILQK